MLSIIVKHPLRADQSREALFIFLFLFLFLFFCVRYHDNSWKP